MTPRTLTLYSDEWPDEREFYVETEDRQEHGWVVLVREVWCPANCAGGEVLGGDTLYRCSTCNGDAWVSVGIGGALLTYSSPFSLPEEPTLTFWRNTLRGFVPAENALRERETK